MTAVISPQFAGAFVLLSQTLVGILSIGGQIEATARVHAPCYAVLFYQICLLNFRDKEEAALSLSLEKWTCLTVAKHTGHMNMHGILPYVDNATGARGEEHLRTCRL